MSNAQKQQVKNIVSVGYDKLTQTAITVMTALILFWGKEVYSDIKQLRADSETDKAAHSAQTEINKSMDMRLTKLENPK